MESTGRALIVYPPRGKLLGMAVAAAGFAVGGFALAGVATPVLAVAGALGGVGFTVGTAVLCARALRPGPTLVVDAEGITERTALSPAGLVRWEEIAALRKREIGRGRGAERLVEIVLVDPEGFTARPRTAMRRIADRYRAWSGHPLVAIPDSMVSWRVSDLVDEVLRWRPDLPVLGPPPAPPRWFGRGSTASRHPRPPRW